MYKVIISPVCKEEFDALEKKLQDRVRKILEKLRTRLCGEKLQGALKDFWSVHFERNKYRLIYKKDKGVIEILILSIGKKTDNFYENLEKKLRSQGYIK